MKQNLNSKKNSVNTRYGILLNIKKSKKSQQLLN